MNSLYLRVVKNRVEHRNVNYKIIKNCDRDFKEYLNVKHLNSLQFMSTFNSEHRCADLKADKYKAVARVDSLSTLKCISKCSHTCFLLHQYNMLSCYTYMIQSVCIFVYCAHVERS